MMGPPGFPAALSFVGFVAVESAVARVGVVLQPDECASQETRHGGHALESSATKVAPGNARSDVDGSAGDVYRGPGYRTGHPRDDDN